VECQLDEENAIPFIMHQAAQDVDDASHLSVLALCLLGNLAHVRPIFHSIVAACLPRVARSICNRTETRPFSRSVSRDCPVSTEPVLMQRVAKIYHITTAASLSKAVKVCA
jgi:hypothetical protein